MTEVTDDDLCPEGYYCPSGSIKTNVEANYLCPIGYYCPKGSVTYHECPDGTESLFEGLSECTACPSGYKCTDGSKETCPAGIVCWANELYPYGTMCNNGTFLRDNMTSVGTMDDCDPCPTG